ncbi:hypothetical protein [Rubricoccus marinus]|nr:hypothetical protein [Rubricoccus marinus]
MRSRQITTAVLMRTRRTPPTERGIIIGVTTADSDGPLAPEAA